jgi:hypothetical protein
VRRRRFSPPGSSALFGGCTRGKVARSGLVDVGRLEVKSLVKLKGVSGGLEEYVLGSLPGSAAWTAVDRPSASYKC